jgi:biopolymer transport protein ExbB
MFEVIVRFFQDGGTFMYPIAIVLVLGLAITIERFAYLGVAKQNNRAAFDRLMPLIKRRDYRGALKLSNESGAAIAGMLGGGLSRLLNGQQREEIEYAMEEGLMEVLPRLEKRTQYLATLANVATLLGLLGTIIGLIAAFTAVANADPAEKASLLSQSISVAMNTTAFGLMSAIPLLLFHSILQTRTNEIVDSFEMAGIKVMNLITEKSAVATPAEAR